MHWIERHILKELAFSTQQRYSDLKPDSVDGNLFQYHARALEKRGLIDRSDDGYRLTPSGQIFVADLSQTKLMNPRKLARAVAMIVCRNDDGQYLLFKWQRQPYRGLASLPFGRQLAGMSAAATAADQLLNKTGYQADLAFYGLADIIIGQDKLIDHLLVEVFIGSDLKQVAQPDGLTGQYFWDQADQIKSGEAIHGFHQLIAWTEQPESSRHLEVNAS
jgi:8-oxo-dGTP pyrophosphatase MutT (NUDIX family)